MQCLKIGCWAPIKMSKKPPQCAGLLVGWMCLVSVLSLECYNTGPFTAVYCKEHLSCDFSGFSCRI